MDPDSTSALKEGPAAKTAAWSDYALWKLVRRVVISVLGFSVLLVGVVMIVAPGPAFVVIPLGLAILATEFVWAKKILESVKTRLLKQMGRATEEDPRQKPSD